MPDEDMIEIENDDNEATADEMRSVGCTAMFFLSGLIVLLVLIVILLITW